MRPTDACSSSLLPHDCNTFYDGGARIVDAIKQRLSSESARGVVVDWIKTDLQLYHRGSMLDLLGGLATGMRSLMQRKSRVKMPGVWNWTVIGEEGEWI